MEDLFLRERQISFMICECFRVTGPHEAVLDDSDLLLIALHGDDIEDFDTRLDEKVLFFLNQSCHQQWHPGTRTQFSIFSMYEQVARGTGRAYRES